MILYKVCDDNCNDQNYDIMYMFHVIKKKKREREICD